MGGDMTIATSTYSRGKKLAMFWPLTAAGSPTELQCPVMPVSPSTQDDTGLKPATLTHHDLWWILHREQRLELIEYRSKFLFLKRLGDLEDKRKNKWDEVTVLHLFSSTSSASIAGPLSAE
jgi:hypothetical protein